MLNNEGTYTPYLAKRSPTCVLQDLTDRFKSHKHSLINFMTNIWVEAFLQLQRNTWRKGESGDINKSNG